VDPGLKKLMTFLEISKEILFIEKNPNALFTGIYTKMYVYPVYPSSWFIHKYLYF